MKHLLPSLVLATLLPRLATAQTYYYINSISVDPPVPTTSDAITIELHGDLSSTGAYIVSSSGTVIGNTVMIDIVAADPGGFTVLVPHVEAIPIGMLPAGNYTIQVNGTFVWDMAPSPQHLFTVTGGGPTACDSLIIDDIQWAPFSDTALIVHVHNTSTTLFPYPGFILYDPNGDTLAKETVTFFGIGGENWHTLLIHDGATIPVGTFTGSLELWTWFGDTLACSWPFTGDLCPPAPCTPLVPFMGNTGGAIVTANITWVITDSTGLQVGSGTFDFDPLNQQDYDTLCVPPGSYTLSVNHPVPVGGQLWISAQADGNYWSTLPMVLFTQDGLADLIPFDFFPGCFDDANGIAPLPPPAGVVATMHGDQLLVSASDGSALGQLTLIDIHGRVVTGRRVTGGEAYIDLSSVPDGVYVLWMRNRSLAQRVVKH